MYSDEDIASAVQAGILTNEDATSFRNYVDQLREAPSVDDENFRLIRGFNDIFVVIACLLLLSSITWIGTELISWLGALLQTVAAWALAEYFTRRRLMAFPSIVLLLAFVGGVLVTGIILLGKYDFSEEVVGVVSSGAAALAAWFHWIRFKVPITVAAGMATLVASVISLLFFAVPETKQWVHAMTFSAGLMVFVVAMRWDFEDILRQTRKSDVAFWLHLVAAPLLVHPIFSFLEVFEGQTEAWQAGVVAVLYIVLAFISISIDRRALMVSALTYVLYTFSTLLEEYGVVSLNFAFAAFIIGGGLLLLSAFWHTCRKSVLSFYPSSIQGLLPPSLRP